ncbi:MAG: hypothetical protein R3C55_12305 [Parvularculaceae bacterium]
MMTSALVPWTTCGVFMAGNAGRIDARLFALRAFLNLLNPLLAVLYGFFRGIAIVYEDGRRRLRSAAVT